MNTLAQGSWTGFPTTFARDGITISSTAVKSIEAETKRRGGSAPDRDASPKAGQSVLAPLDGCNDIFSGSLLCRRTYASSWHDLFASLKKGPSLPDSRRGLATTQKVRAVI